MNTELHHRLNQILPIVTSVSFLSSEGIGNEIACYIFDYPAEDELAVRDHLDMLVGRLSSHHAELKVRHLNLFDVCLSYMESRSLLDKALEKGREQGDAILLGALKGIITGEKIRDFIAERYSPSEQDLVLMSGVGTVWPVLRAHNLLNCLHTIMDGTPLVLFYPGNYDGTSLRLFGRIAPLETAPASRSYYRAFNLVPSKSHS